MLIVLFFLSITLMYVISIAAIAYAIGDSPAERKALAAIGISIPVLVPWAALKTMGKMLQGYRLATYPCPDGFEEVEKDIDEKRVALFGGSLKTRYLAHTWQRAYYLSLGKSAQAIHLRFVKTPNTGPRPGRHGATIGI